jgi:hypothetical protein
MSRLEKRPSSGTTRQQRVLKALALAGAPRHQRLRVAATILSFGLIAMLASAIPHAQTPAPPGTLRAGANVNMGAGPLKLELDSAGNILNFIGDPLQRQSEPSIACSPYNPLMCVAAANDTKLVNAPSLADVAPTADAWLGLFWTTNGGKSWTNKLVPGFPRDASPEGLASPLRGKEAAADPTVRAGVRINANGTSDALFYVSGIAFNRGDVNNVTTAGVESKKGISFVAVYRDARDASKAPIYEGTFVIDNGGNGQFLDKTWLDTGLTVGTQGCGPIQYGETVFTGNGTNNPSKLYTSRSTDCGRTWSQLVKLSEGTQTIQSANVAFNLKTGDVYLTWRLFATSNLSAEGQVLFSKSSNGKVWSKPVVIRNYGLWNASTAPDQVSLPAPDPPYDAFRMFRTNAYPNMCVTTDGVIRIVFSERKPKPDGPDPDSEPDPDPEGFARIMVATSTTGLVGSWTVSPVDDSADLKGNQVMPAIACNTRAIVAWFDQRNDSAPKAFGWSTFPALFGRLIVDPIPAPPTHTVDVRAAQTLPTTGEFGPSVQVSRYRYGWLPTSPPVAFQTEHNVANWPQYGKLPFLGDYIDVAVDRRIVPYTKTDGTTGWRAFGLNPDGSTHPTEPSESMAAHVTWTDNRNVLPSFFDRESPDPNQQAPFTEPTNSWVTVNGVENWQPPTVPGWSTGCIANTTPTANKDQNVYTSFVSDGLMVGELEESQTAGSLRAYAVYIKNTTSSMRRFRATTDHGSFSYAPPVQMVIDLDVPANNTRAITVVLQPNEQAALTTVTVTELLISPAPNELYAFLGLKRSIVLTPGDGLSESHTVDLIVHPFTFTVDNPIFDPDNPIFDPDNPIFDPDNPIFDPDNPIFDPDNPIFDPDNPIFDPDNPIFDPDNPIFDPDNPIFDPDNPIFDPDNSALDDGEPSAYDQQFVTQITSTITNDGTVSGGYDISTTLSSLPADVIWQLVVARVAPTTRIGTDQCVIYNMPKIEAVTNVGTTGSQAITSTALAAGETALLIIRLYHSGQLGLPGPGTQGEDWLKQHLTISVASQAEPPVSNDFYGNRAPVAVDGVLATNEDTAANGILSATDSDSDALTYSVVVNPTRGTVEITNTATGAYTYTPNANANGADSFTFKANDGVVDSNVATVSITVNAVNDAPVASNGSLTTNEDTAKAGTLAGSDVDSASLTYSIVGAPSKGTAIVTNSATGAFTYTPNANATGADSFTFKVNDGAADSNVATVSVTINAVNDAPIAVADAKSTALNVAITFPATDLTANDSDVEGNIPLTVSGVGSPVNGTVSLNSGQVTFTPAFNFAGNGSFSYTVCDSLAACSTGNVTVTVTQAYTFVAVSFPASGQQGSVLPLTWQYKLNGAAVDTGSLVPVVRIRALTACNGQAVETGAFTENKQLPGNADFQYSTTTFIWKFNWQTKLFAPGCYHVYIRLMDSTGTTILQDNGPMKIQLKK